MSSVRSRKKQIASHLFMCMLGRQLERWLTETGPSKVKVPNYLETHCSFNAGEFEALQKADETNAKLEYVVVKVNGGEVVDTFDTREEALELVLKHHRHKKAKLQVMYSTTGELVLFTEEEMMA